MYHNDPVISKWLRDPKKAKKFHIFLTAALIGSMLSLMVGGIVMVLALAGFF